MKQKEKQKKKHEEAIARQQTRNRRLDADQEAKLNAGEHAAKKERTRLRAKA